MGKSIYLDHHTATEPFPRALEKMLPFHREQWGALSAPHQKGQALIAPALHSLDQLYEQLGASEEAYRFIQMSSSFEIISELFFSIYLEVVRKTGKNHFLTAATEEAPILMGVKRLEPLGCTAKTIPLNAHGQITREALEQAIGPRTALVSLSGANSLTGVIHPIADLADLCQKKEVLFHLDATYLLGKQFFRVQDLNLDFLSFEGDKIHAPKGAAGLLIKKSFPDSIQRPFSLPGLVGLSCALEQLGSLFEHLCMETARLRDKFEKGILEGYPEAVIFFQNAERLPNCSAIGFPGVASDALLYLLHRKGVYASLGGGQTQKLSHLLTACGIEPQLAHTALSFSLSYDTQEEEIDAAIEIIVSAARHLRTFSKAIL